MKKILTIIIVLLEINLLYSQNTMYIHQTGGSVINYPLSSIDSITFGTSHGTVTDFDGNMYDTIIICGQIWLKQNLKVTRYRNGESIHNNTENAAWSNLTTGSYCDYENTPGNSSTYGKLYNYYTVIDSRNLCPIGWHVPSDAEWTTLENCLGGINIAGADLKETRTTHWKTPNTGATNSSGFTALPGGYRDINGDYGNISEQGYWWSTTGSSSSYAYFHSLTYDNKGVSRGNYSRSFGFSVRCVKD